jgi:hypothetical protein
VVCAWLNGSQQVDHSLFVCSIQHHFLDTSILTWNSQNCIILIAWA